MALSYSRKARLQEGNVLVRLVDFTADAAYGAGGYTLAASDFESFLQLPGATTSSVLSFLSEQNAGGYSVVLDKANSKLKYMLGGTEATTTVSSTVVRARITYGASNHL